MTEHRRINDQSNSLVDEKYSSEPLPPLETEFYPINAKYRLRRHVLKCARGNVVMWDLQKQRKKYGALVWEFVANDKSPVRLVLYCKRLGIMSDPEHAEALSSLAYR